MKTFKTDKCLSEQYLSSFYYDGYNGVIRKKSTGKIMKAKTVKGSPILVIPEATLYQNRVVCWMNGVDFTPSCSIHHINGDVTDIRVSNLKVTPFKHHETNISDFDFSLVAKNDKYLSEFSNHYDYNKITGEITNKRGKIIKNSSDKGYVVLVRKVEGRSVNLLGHRLAMFMCGHDINKYEIDHIDGDRTNNKYNNLRLVSRSVNRRNAARSKINKSGVSGVSWHKNHGKWEIKGSRRTIGYHGNFFEACCIRKSWENSQGCYTERHGVVDSIY